MAGALLSVKCYSFVRKIMNESRNFEVAHLEEEEEEERKKEQHFGCLATFWFGTFMMLFRTTGCGFVMKILEVERYIVIKAYKLRDFLYNHILRVHAIPTHRVYRLYDNIMEIA